MGAPTKTTTTTTIKLIIGSQVFIIIDKEKLLGQSGSEPAEESRLERMKELQR